MVDCPGHQLLARAAFAKDEYSGLAALETADCIKSLAKGPGFSHNARQTKLLGLAGRNQGQVLG